MIHTIGILDTETGGLDPKVDPLVEVAVAVWSVDDGCLVSCWSDLVLGISNAAEPVNRIPVAALERGADRADVLANARAYTGRCNVICAHRAEFDRGFMGDLGKPWVCTKFECEWPNVKLGASLVETCLALGVGVTHNHRAITDVLLLARCFDALFAREGAAGVRAMLDRAMRPRATFEALVSYEDREQAKAACFQWRPETKRWVRTMAIEDAEKLPFRTARVPA